MAFWTLSTTIYILWVILAWLWTLPVDCDFMTSIISMVITLNRVAVTKLLLHWLLFVDIQSRMGIQLLRVIIGCHHTSHPTTLDYSIRRPSHILIGLANVLAWWSWLLALVWAYILHAFQLGNWDPDTLASSNWVLFLLHTETYLLSLYVKFLP